MNEPTTPSRILLATYMNARCDLALDRAAQWAQAWRSNLAVVRAVQAAEVAERVRLSGATPSWRRPESSITTLDSRLRADLAVAGVSAASEVVVGAPADIRPAAAGNVVTALIVLGIAKDTRRGGIQLGSTVDSVVRQSPVPVSVLNIRGRVHPTGTSSWRPISRRRRDKPCGGPHAGSATPG